MTFDMMNFEKKKKKEIRDEWKLKSFLLSHEWFFLLLCDDDRTKKYNLCPQWKQEKKIFSIYSEMSNVWYHYYYYFFIFISHWSNICLSLSGIINTES